MNWAHSHFKIANDDFLSDGRGGEAKIPSMSRSVSVVGQESRNALPLSV